MSHVDPEEIAGLALDPADASPRTRAHVESCADCADLLAAFLDVRAVAGSDAFVTPPPGLRERALAAALGDDVHRLSPHDPSAAALVAGGASGAQADPASVDPAPAAPIPLRRRRGVPLWLATAAAVIGLVAGLGMGRWSAPEPEAAPSPDPTPTATPTVVASARLTALDSSAPRGDVEAYDDGDDVVSVSVRARELGTEDGFHEVWLINVDGKRMIALGFLARGDDGVFDVPRRYLDAGYRILDISVEPDDGDPAHSGVSLARGELA